MSDTRLKILQVITPSKLAGAEIFVSLLSRKLAEQGHRVTVACKPIRAVVKRMESDGIRVRPMRIGGKVNPLAPILLARLIREEQPDILNTHLTSASLTGSIAGRLCRVPVVATMHGLGSATCYRLADHIISVSDAVKKHLVSQGIRGERITTIYPGIDLEAFSPSGKGEAVRAEFGIDDDAVVIGVIAHLTYKKGHHVFLSAAEEVARRAPNAVFVVAGTGPRHRELRAMSETLGLAGRVIFTGFRSDIREVIEAMDVVVLPSIAGEGLPASLIQAMALSKPTIGSRLSGIPEVIEDGASGLLVTPGDTAELADAIVALARDERLRREMGTHARERAESHFDITTTVESTTALYRKLLSQGRS